ncbi:hypothetical protein QL285_082307 [Trifolium repens]|nr:hypothetical protein QL285_082307 [Trifolium repens]
MCSLCHNNAKTTFHLFFECNFAFTLWCWLAYVFDLTLHFQSIDDIWKLCDRARSPQCNLTIKAAIINSLNAIWYARFNSKATNCKSAIAWIISSTALASNKSNCAASSSITDFLILKRLNIPFVRPKIPLYSFSKEL